MRPPTPVALLLAAALGVIAALWTWTLPGDAALGAGPSTTRILVIDNGFHTDLALPRAALEARSGALADLVRGLPSGDWVLVGWGDAKFFVDQSPITDRLPEGVRAFFRPGNASVLMLDPHAGDPARGLPPARVRPLVLSDAAFASLATRIEASLDLSSGSPRLTTSRPGAGARFYAARGHFWILNLCNNWAARTLNAAGLPVRPLRSVVSAEVIAAIDRDARGGAELDRGGPGA